MFYVIGSDKTKSGSASYSSCQQNQRRGGAVRHFRCTDTVSDETDLWWNIGIQLCHHYTDTSLIRQVSECLSLYSEFQRAIFNGIRKRSLYWLGHLEAIYQRVLENFLLIPPEKTFTFVPGAGNFLSSGSRWESHFVHNLPQMVASENELFMRASAAIFPWSSSKNASLGGYHWERFFLRVLPKTPIPSATT